ncbi:hypothetical protein L249_3244, partial [Ophiocordyceps polyrhachis-furcata BCC 54312]
METSQNRLPVACLSGLVPGHVPMATQPAHVGTTTDFAFFFCSTPCFDISRLHCFFLFVLLVSVPGAMFKSPGVEDAAVAVPFMCARCLLPEGEHGGKPKTGGRVEGGNTSFGIIKPHSRLHVAPDVDIDSDGYVRCILMEMPFIHPRRRRSEKKG